MCTRHEPHNPHCSACLIDAPAATESIFGWNTWSGGEMPVPPGVLIEVEYRDGSGCVARAGDTGARWWGNRNHPNDIVRYRLRNPAEGVDPVLKAPKHSHYFKDVSALDWVDVYRVLALFNVVDPCLQHAVKKLLVAGGRGGGKDISRDIGEAIDTLKRWQDMRHEEVAS